MPALRTLLHYLNQLVTATGLVWWRCLPRLLVVAMLGWLGYRIFAQLSAMLVEVSAWWSLLMLSLGFVVRLSSIIIGLRIAGEALHIRSALPLAEDDPRDNSISHLLSMTLLPFLGIYAVFDTVTDAANRIEVDYYVFHGLTFERPVLSQLSPQGAGVWVIVGAIVGLYVLRRLVDLWFDRTGFRPLGLLAALIEGFFLLIVILSGRQVLVSLSHWVDERTFRVWLDYPGWGLQQVFLARGIDLSDVLDQLGDLWWNTIWPGVSAMVVEPMLWLAVASLVYGSQVLSAADLWRTGGPGTGRTPNASPQLGKGQRRLVLQFQQAFFGDVDDKYLPAFQSLRLVLGVGPTFFAAFILCYGLLSTGGVWIGRAVDNVLGGHPATFWAVAGPVIDLGTELIVQPLTWVLLAASFRACLDLFAARAGLPGQAVSQ